MVPYGSIKIVKVDTKSFIITSNAVDALLYTKDMHIITFLVHDNEE